MEKLKAFSKLYLTNLIFSVVLFYVVNVALHFEDFRKAFETDYLSSGRFFLETFWIFLAVFILTLAIEGISFVYQAIVKKQLRLRIKHLIGFSVLFAVFLLMNIVRIT